MPNSYAEGGVTMGGCAEVGMSIFKYLKYGPGSVVYLCYRARIGILERIAIKKVNLVNNQRTYSAYIPVYVDNNNFLYNEDELCNESEAVSLAIAYYERQLAEITYLMEQC